MSLSPTPSHEPLVSVCMVTYNHAPFIREALDSVLMQKVDFPFEICIGEDGSTDGTREICAEYARAHPTIIRLFLRTRSEPERKEYAAFSAFNAVETMRSCRGKYMAILDGDDFWVSPSKLQEQVRAMEANPHAMVCGHYVFSFVDTMRWQAVVHPAHPMPAVFDLRDYLTRKVQVATCSIMYRRVDFERHLNAFKAAPMGDAILHVLHLLQGPGLFLNSIMGCYRMHRGGAYSQMGADGCFEKGLVAFDVLRGLLPAEYHGIMDRRIALTWTTYIRAVRERGRVIAAVRLLAAMLKDVRRRGIRDPSPVRLAMHECLYLVSPRLWRAIAVGRERWKAPKSTHGASSPGQPAP